jgi:hypothetical protein
MPPFNVSIRASFTQLIAATGWLVHKGASYVNQSADLDPTGGFVTEKAPRTALAVMSNGTLLSVTVDGACLGRERLGFLLPIFCST